MDVILQAQLSLRAKGIEYKIIDVNIMTFENLQPWYMRINPAGKVPTLRHGDILVPDSSAIITYLDQSCGMYLSLAMLPFWEFFFHLVYLLLNLRTTRICNCLTSPACDGMVGPHNDNLGYESQLWMYQTNFGKKNSN